MHSTRTKRKAIANIQQSSSDSLAIAIQWMEFSEPTGLGYVILSAQGAFQTTRVFAAIVLLGTILFFIGDLVERLVCPWHVSHRVRHRGQAGGT